MLIVPPMFAAQVFERLPFRLGLTVLHAALSALIGLHLSVWLNCSAAGAMVVPAALLFLAVWGAPQARRWMNFGRRICQPPAGGSRIAGAPS
jgi:ABC-type Mn2+/Zn2+ transport system permease subunit